MKLLNMIIARFGEGQNLAGKGEVFLKDKPKVASRVGSVKFGVVYLWPPCIADADTIFFPCGFYLSSFFRRLISAVRDWMSTILPHMMWP